MKLGKLNIVGIWQFSGLCESRLVPAIFFLKSEVVYCNNWKVIGNLKLHDICNICMMMMMMIMMMMLMFA